MTFDERRVTHSLLKEKGGGEVTLDHQGGITHPLKKNMKCGGEDTLDHEGGENHHYASFHN